LRAAASESAVGVCAMAAASRRSRAAAWKIWPPEAKKLQIASLTGVDYRQGGGERDRGLPVGELVPDAQDLTRLPAAPAGTAARRG
jgi:hypothetical protein